MGIWNHDAEDLKVRVPCNCKVGELQSMFDHVRVIFYLLHTSDFALPHALKEIDPISDKKRFSLSSKQVADQRSE